MALEGANPATFAPKPRKSDHIPSVLTICLRQLTIPEGLTYAPSKCCVPMPTTSGEGWYPARNVGTED